MSTPKINSPIFFNDERNVKEYIEATEGLDGRNLIEILKEHLKPSSKVLELGMGAGKDFDILNETFQTTGSDNSQIFLDIYKQKNPTADLLLLDAVSLETNRKFNCIYSNKVLHHLSTKDLQNSLKRQQKILNKNGILFHTFWRGDLKNEFQDLQFIQYEFEELIELSRTDFEIIDVDLCKEMNLNDSIYLVLQAN